MATGFIRRLARQSYRTTYVSHANSQPTLQDNWTVQETTTYDANNPAASPAPWGGTTSDLDREFTATGSTHLAMGMLLTFLFKPETNNLGQHGDLAGAIAKVIPTFADGSACALELWTLLGSAWTKRRRVALGGLVRSGETLIEDLTGPVLDTDQVDAYWITLAPDLGTETLTWVEAHLYGVCLNDNTTPACPPGTDPEDCAAPQCGVNVATWLCQDPPGEPNAPTVPFILPPIIVPIPNPDTYVLATLHGHPAYFHDCPRPTQLRMLFGLLPGGGSVTVTVKDPAGCTFVEGFSQVISSPGEMTWTVATGFLAANSGAAPALPPSQEFPTTTWLFTRQLDGTVFSVAGNLLDILTYYWTFAVAYVEVCGIFFALAHVLTLLIGMLA